MDSEQRVATFKRYQGYLLQQIWGGLSADERAKVGKNGACNGSSVYKKSKAIWTSIVRPTNSKVVTSTSIRFGHLQTRRQQSKCVFQVHGRRRRPELPDLVKTNGRGVDALEEAARFCIYNDLLDNGMETAWSATNLLVGLVGGAAATAVVSAGVAASAPTFAASGVGAFAVGFAAGEAVEVGMAAMEVYHRCEQYREVSPGITMDRVWGMSVEAFAAPVGLAKGGVCTADQDTGLLISQSRPKISVRSASRDYSLLRSVLSWAR